MNTEYVALPENITVAEAMEALKAHEEILETLNTLFLVDRDERLTASIPLARLFTAAGATPPKGTGRRHPDSRGCDRKAGPHYRTFRQIQFGDSAGG